MKLLINSSAIAIVFGLLFACSNPESATENSSEQERYAAQKPEKTASALPVINIGELPKMSREELRLARNTIYAKYGRVFTSKDLKAHFSKQSWYKERPSFKERDMKEGDRALVELILRWEEKTDVLWKKDIDITGNGRYENCFLLYNKDKGTYSIVVNDFSAEFDHYWGQHEGEAAPLDWADIVVSEVDIDTMDGRHEIHISQRFDDWVDPGYHNIVVAFKNGVKVSELFSTNYDAGQLTFHGNGKVTMQQSFCPEHEKYYRLKKGELVLFDEKIGKTPPGGCAACFTGDMLVATGDKQSIRIDALRRGDQILSYDFENKMPFTTTVKRILEVYHEELYEIRVNGTTIRVTIDHPFRTDQGWCSLAPKLTKERYDYDCVSLLDVNTKVIHENGLPVAIEAIRKLNDGQITYTIESLEKGDTFILNGIVVGVESRARETL
jgi:hypothetical protein